MKGGHLQGSPTDISIEGNAPPFIKRHERIKNSQIWNRCSYAALQALAKGMSLQEVVEEGLFFCKNTQKSLFVTYFG